MATDYKKGEFVTESVQILHSDHCLVWISEEMLPSVQAGKAQRDDRTTAVHKAVLLSDEVMLESLLKDNGAVNAQYCTGSTPLHLACSIDQTAVVQMLLDHGAKINARRNEDKYTPIHVAALCGDLHTVRMLIAKGADIEASNKFKNRPLHLAAGCGHEKVVKLLLESNARTEVLNASKNSPLALAACGEHSKVVQTLLENGANVNCFYLSRCLLLVMVKWKLLNVALVLIQYGSQQANPENFAALLLDNGTRQLPTLCQALVESGNCPWLKQKIIWGIDMQKADLTQKFRSWLRTYQSEPQPLRVQCRKKIRGHLLHRVSCNQSLCKAIESLKMPQPIRNYLLMKDYIL